MSENNILIYGMPAHDYIIGRLSSKSSKGLQDILSTLRYDGIKNNQIIEILKPYPSEIADWAIRNLKITAKSNAELQLFNRAIIMQLIELIEMGYKSSDIRKVINDNKSCCIYYFLDKIKNDMSSHRGPVLDYELTKLFEKIDYIKNLGFDWPELNIIENSLNQY